MAAVHSAIATTAARSPGSQLAPVVHLVGTVDPVDDDRGGQEPLGSRRHPDLLSHRHGPGQRREQHGTRFRGTHLWCSGKHDADAETTGGAVRDGGAVPHGFATGTASHRPVQRPRLLGTSHTSISNASADNPATAWNATSGPDVSHSTPIATGPTNAATPWTA